MRALAGLVACREGLERAVEAAVRLCAGLAVVRDEDEGDDEALLAAAEAGATETSAARTKAPLPAAPFSQTRPPPRSPPRAPHSMASSNIEQPWGRRASASPPLQLHTSLVSPEIDSTAGERSRGHAQQTRPRAHPTCAASHRPRLGLASPPHLVASRGGTAPLSSTSPLSSTASLACNLPLLTFLRLLLLDASLSSPPRRRVRPSPSSSSRTSPRSHCSTACRTDFATLGRKDKSSKNIVNALRCVPLPTLEQPRSTTKLTSLAPPAAPSSALLTSSARSPTSSSSASSPRTRAAMPSP